MIATTTTALTSTRDRRTRVAYPRRQASFLNAGASLGVSPLSDSTAVEPRFDPRRPGVRRLVQASLAAMDTVEVRVMPGHAYQQYEGVDSEGRLREPTTYLPGESFSVPRRTAAELLPRGAIELA
jgi:hypothetical protein